MEFEFIDWSYLSTFAGCLVIVLAVTEVIKNFVFIKKIPTQIVSWALAFAVIVLSNVFTDGVTVSEIVLAAFNSVFISLAANGGYDAIKRVTSGKKE